MPWASFPVAAPLPRYCIRRCYPGLFPEERLPAVSRLAAIVRCAGPGAGH